MSRRGNNERDLRKRRKTRSPYARVLIVCEGGKSEPNYFQAFIDDLQLNTANVEVNGSSGSSPRSVVDYAKHRYKDELKQQGASNGFDRVYWVIDKDEHSTYDEALRTLRSAMPKNVFFAIPSVPCFEFWLLLHFVFTTKPIVRTGNRSPGDNACSELKRFLSGYKKGNQSAYTLVKQHTDSAIENAKKVNKACSQANTDNPTTLVHELVEYLRTLGK